MPFQIFFDVDFHPLSPILWLGDICFLATPLVALMARVDGDGFEFVGPIQFIDQMIDR
jgi:hypothetical protein